MLYFLEMKWLVKSEEEMKRLGARFGAQARGGECLELVGDIGAGKTTFTKGLAHGMGITDTVQSPTFTISRLYETPHSLRLAHYDFYRLPDAGIMADELHDTASDEKTVVVIEWGDVIRDVLPKEYIEITFRAMSEAEREVEAKAHGVKGRALLEGIAT